MSKGLYKKKIRKLEADKEFLWKELERLTAENRNEALWSALYDKDSLLAKYEDKVKEVKKERDFLRTEMKRYARLYESEALIVDKLIPEVMRLTKELKLTNKEK